MFTQAKGHSNSPVATFHFSFDLSSSGTPVPYTNIYFFYFSIPSFPLPSSPLMSPCTREPMGEAHRTFACSQSDRRISTRRAPRLLLLCQLLPLQTRQGTRLRRTSTSTAPYSLLPLARTLNLKVSFVLPYRRIH